ncbi:class I SAM-dependent methyltransferase [Microbulbifer sp. OS29]|uniref:Class I SAM-dependent methyltransferase n=1 Tax=Microbulbifer okhotskensis TaxID=2926617 RepID=A0A9X2EQD2_9GAMM|nr:class I SAM-dependent methyltransferase [Microbulbifer okhotskensis]MCO1333738.1 class I SAM-dependent methyltransferase [Microbulbifer okhotskensis]
MPNSEFSDDQVLSSWHKNAQAWTQVVDNGAIPSRKLITDAAIVATVLEYNPASVLDIGCGEGWLSRKLAGQGIQVCGIDGIAPLVKTASERAGINESYRQFEYQEICAKNLAQKFEVIVCNFSLIGRESVEQIFKNAGEILHPNGYLIVQTLHPYQSCGDADYLDGWRRGSWEGIAGDFHDAAPWYFRTLASWLQLFADNGFVLAALREPKAASLPHPSSLILCGKINADTD